MDHEAEAVRLTLMTRRTLLVRLGQGVVALAGAGTLAAIGTAPNEALAKERKQKNNRSNTKKKSDRRIRSNPRKGSDNKKPKNHNDD